MKFIKKERKAGILWLTVDREKSLNALSPELVEELTEAVAEAEKEKMIRIVVITGAGKAFVAGADIGYMQDLTPSEAQDFAAKTCELYRRIEKSRKIYIAAINGFALGGGLELALACDIRIASQKAKMGLPEVGLGIIPGGGGTQRLPRLIGEGKAMELIVTGERITAMQAEKLGLVNQVTEAEMLESAVMEMAEKIMKMGPKAVSYGKAAIKTGVQMDLNSAVIFENRLFGLCFAEKEQKEGMTAFMEKRGADWSV